MQLCQKGRTLHVTYGEDLKLCQELAQEILQRATLKPLKKGRDN